MIARMPYNEIHDEAGTVRPAYAAVRARTGIDVTKPDATVISNLAGQRIHPLPLVLGEDEYQSTLVPGLLQRALMLQAVFEDVAIGSARMVETGLLRWDEVEFILAAAGLGAKALRQLWTNQSREQIRFVYGPDLVRGPGGEWVVLEDNVGCVGGVIQGHATRDAYRDTAGLADAGRPPRTDLAGAIEAFLGRIGIQPSTNGLYGFAGPASCGPTADFETLAKTECLQSFGITVMQPEELLNRIYAGSADPAAIVNLSGTISAAHQELGRALLATAQVPFVGAPGVEVIASKSFLPFDQEFADQYLGDELLIRSTPTRILREPDRLPSNGVLKRSNGCQGTEVFFLDDVTDENASRALLEAVHDWGPCGAILQELVEPSILPGTSDASLGPVKVEIRPIVYVYGWQMALVGSAIAGRAVSVDAAERRSNISRGASLLPVLCEAPNHH